jgi:predicted small secreted protein
VSFGASGVLASGSETPASSAAGVESPQPHASATPSSAARGQVVAAGRTIGPFYAEKHATDSEPGPKGGIMRKSTLLPLVFLAFSASTAACSAGDTVAPAGGPLEYYAPIVLQCGAAAARAGDIDGDGKKDLVTAIKTGSSYEALVYLNTGGSFADPVRTSIDRDYFKLFDVDADGRDDLITSSNIYYGEVGGTFGRRTKASLPSGESRFDVNGDGYPDILAYSSSSKTITAYSVNGDGSTIELFEVNDIPAYPEYADLDHDGAIDIVYALGSAVVARFGQGAGSFSQARAIITADMLVTSISDVDIDGDKVADLVLVVGTQQSSTEGYVVVRNKGDGTFAQVKQLRDEPNVNYTFTDATGDGRMDIVLTEGEQLAILPGTGTGTFGAATLVTGPWSKASNNAFVDLNNDGRLDLVVADTVMSVLIHK